MHPRPPARGGKDRIVLASILLGAFLLGLRLLPVPFERDEGEYAYIAWLMGEGGMPYHDAFDQKPPAIFLAYRGAMALFGPTIVGIHIAARLWLLGAAAILFFAGRRLFSRGVGFTAAAIFAVASWSPGLLGQAANTETFMVLPLAAAALFAWRCRGDDGGPLDALFAGLLVGIATAFKPVAATDGAFFLGWIAVGTSGARAGGRSLLSRAGSFVAGVAAPWAALVVWLGARGALPYFWNDAVLLNLGYARAGFRVAFVNLGVTTRYFLVPYLWPLLILTALGTWRALAVRHDHGDRPDRRAAGIFLVCWLGAAALGTSSGGHFREHYFFQMLAPASLAAALALDWLTSRLRALPLRAAVTAGVVLLPAILNARLFLLMNPEECSEAIYMGDAFVESRQVAEVVRQNSSASDRVLVVGSEPQILFYARRRSATRYILTYPLMMDIPGAADRQVDFVREAIEADPALVVAVNIRVSHLYGPWTSNYLFEQINALIDRDYVPLYPETRTEGEIPPFVVVKRKATPVS